MSCVLSVLLVRRLHREHFTVEDILPLEQLQYGLTNVVYNGYQKFVSICWFPLFIVDEAGNVLYEGKGRICCLRSL